MCCEYCDGTTSQKAMKPVRFLVVDDDFYPDEAGRTYIQNVLEDCGRNIEMVTCQEDGIIVWIDGLEDDEDFGERKSTGIEFPAKYCPWCGEKLSCEEVSA